MATLRTSELFAAANLRLIAVESVDIRPTRTKTGGYVYASLQPVAVIVCRPEGNTAFDMQARPTSVEQLRKDVPALDLALA
jgi:hypothetical protein